MIVASSGGTFHELVGHPFEYWWLWTIVVIGVISALYLTRRNG